MEIRVLGDLSIDGGPLSPKERSLLAALVVRSGSIVTPSELADAVWGDDVPGTWPKQVQAAVGHIRRAIGSDAVSTTRGGYRLVAAPDDVDATRFEGLLRAAGEHRADGDPVRAVDVLEHALTLWRGEPYADLAAWPPAAAEAERLSELRATAEEDLLQARLDSGEHRSVVPDAERLVRTEPLRERRWAILATALYRGGRQADALAALRRARDLLGDELGIEPGASLVALETAILRQDDALDPPPAPPRTSEECPYRGLQPFGAENAAEFFGRDDDVAAALARLAHVPFLAIAGSSGCGKSSLVMAGIVPALRARGRSVAILGSGAASVARLRDALDARGRTDVVVVDQFEELFHAGLPESDVVAFCRLLAGAVGTGRQVVVAVRSDYLDECAGQEDLAPFFTEGVHLLGSLTARGLRQAVEEPARKAGLRLEPGLTEVIVRDAAGAPGVLPHVSHALVETWLRREGATMTVAGYEESGGITGAIAQSADRLYGSLDAAQREICRSTFLRLVEIDTDGAPIRRRMPLDPMHADAAHEQVLAGLARARLVSAEEATLVVAHESLALAWPRLRGWLEEDAEGTRTMHALAAAAAAWDAAGRSDEDLYRGARLHAAIEWREGSHPELTTAEHDFLVASAAQEQAAALEIERRAEHDRRQNRSLRILLAAAVALFAIAGAAGVFVAIGAQETERQRTAAQIGDLTSTSLALRETERDVAALLAVEAYRRWPDDSRTRSALLGVMQASNGLVSTTYVPGVRDMSGRVIPGTRSAVVVTDSQVAVLDVETARVVRVLDIPRIDIFTDTRQGPAISADGRVVAVSERTWPEDHLKADGSVLHVAEVGSGERILGPVEFDVPLSTIAISPDGSAVATIDTLGALRLVDTASGAVEALGVGAEHEEEMDSDHGGALGYTPDGRLLVSTVSGDVLVIDPVTRAVITRIRPPAGSTAVSMTVVSDDLAVVTGDDRISAVDLAHDVVSWSQGFGRDVLEPCSWVAASAVRSTIYCGDLWGRIEERDLTTGQATGRRFDPQLSTVGPVAVSEDGTTLDVVGRGAAAFTRWRLDGAGPATRIIAPGSVVGDAYSSSGSRLFTAAAPTNSAARGPGYAIVDSESGETVFRVPSGWDDMGWAGDVLIGLGPDRELELMSPETGGHWPLDFRDLDFLAPSADARTLYAARVGGEIQAIDPTTGEPTGTGFELGQFILSVTTDADDSRVLITASNTKGEVVSGLFDTGTGELIRSGPTGPWTVLTERDEIISVTDDRITRLDADTFEPTGALPGVPGGFAQISVTRDGRTLAAFARDGTVSLYDLVDGIRLGAPIPVAFPEIRAGFIRPDGAELAVNSDDGIAIWDLDPATQAHAACRIAGRDLTPDEWTAYLGGLGDHRSTCGLGDG